MTRVPLIDPDDPDADPDAVEALRELQRRYGGIANVQRGLANHPTLLLRIFDMADAAYFDNHLDPVTRELAYYASAVTNHCHYWVPTHVMLGRAAGISEEKLAAVTADPLPDGVYEPHEAAVVAFARASTLMQPIDDRTWSALTEHFDLQQLMEIIVTVGFNQMISRFHAAVHTEVDEFILDRVPEQSCPVRLPPRPPA